MRKWLTILLAILLAALPALAEDTAAPATPAAATATETAFETGTRASVPGGFAARTDRDIYAALPNGDTQALARISRGGGEPMLADQAEGVSELVALGDVIYYLRAQSGATALYSRSGDGAPNQVYAFSGGEPHGLSAFGSELYVIIDDQLHVIYPGSGLCLKLVGTRMSEYVIVGDYAYFVSLEDVMRYETASLMGGERLSVEGGCLYRLNMSTGNTALLIKSGMEDLRYGGGKLYFHNLADSYVMGSGDKEWMEGRLYSFDLAGQSLNRVLEDYDWDFRPAPEGVAVYTADAVTYYPSAGASKSLYSPEGYLLLAGDDQGLIAYEQSVGKLVLIYYDGTVADANEGDLSAVLPATTSEPEGSAGTTLAQENGAESGNSGADWNWGDGDDSGSGSGSSGGGSGSSGGGSGSSSGNGSGSGSSGGNSGSSGGGSNKTDSSYIFKNSSTKKLTEQQILNLDRSMWAYARNEIYARHGYEFKNSAYRKYFSKKTWYKPGGFSVNDLNATEWYNMDLIKKMESQYDSNGNRIDNGGGSGGGSNKTDSSYIFKNSSTKKLTRQQILNLDRSMWAYARNEIYARHGYEFKNSAYRKYFSKKTWYKPGGFSVNDLNDIEWYNMNLIKSMEDEY